MKEKKLTPSDTREELCEETETENEEREYMDVFKYVKSRDVREFLWKIGYSFSATEAAWLIYHGKNLTLEERNEAFRELKEKYEDEYIDLEDAEYKGSLFAYLDGLVEREKCLLSLFIENEKNAVYKYSFYDGNEWIEDDDLYKSFYDCSKAFEDDLEYGPRFVEYVKKYSGRTANKIVCRMTVDKKPVEVFDECFGDEPLLDRKYDDFDGSLFYYLSTKLDIPTPFREGDIVEFTGGKYAATPSFASRCVIMRTGRGAEVGDVGFAEHSGGKDACPDGASKCPCEKKACPDGYFILDDLGVYRESIRDAVDYEYMRGELEDEERFLIPLSKYIKGEVELGVLLAAYRMTIGETMAKNGREALDHYK